MTQRVGPDSLPRRNRAQFLSAFHRNLHLTPCCRGMSLDDSVLADVLEVSELFKAPCSSGCVKGGDIMSLFRINVSANC